MEGLRDRGIEGWRDGGMAMEEWRDGRRDGGIDGSTDRRIEERRIDGSKNRGMEGLMG